MSAIFFSGDVSERPKVQLSKSCVGESPPWVQIPPSPLRMRFLIEDSLSMLWLAISDARQKRF